MAVGGVSGNNPPQRPPRTEGANGAQGPNSGQDTQQLEGQKQDLSVQRSQEEQNSEEVRAPINEAIESIMTDIQTSMQNVETLKGELSTAQSELTSAQSKTKTVTEKVDGKEVKKEDKRSSSHNPT